jgi:adenosylmethionine-8-amino-7-oxononanoate aminotransferase
MALKDKYDIIGDVRGGHGLMTGVELVSDKGAKTPMDPTTMKRFHAAAYDAGVMVRVGGNTIMMSPPLVITEAEIDTVLAGIEAGLNAA